MIVNPINASIGASSLMAACEECAGEGNPMMPTHPNWTPPLGEEGQIMWLSIPTARSNVAIAGSSSLGTAGLYRDE